MIINEEIIKKAIEHQDKVKKEPIKEYGWIRIAIYYPIFYLVACWGLLRKGKDHWMYHDWTCGKHSGFRACCRLWYIFWWSFVHSGEVNKVRILRSYCKDLRERGNGEYLECALCSTLKRKTLHAKRCDCGQKRSGSNENWSFDDPSKWKKVGW